MTATRLPPTLRALLAGAASLLLAGSAWAASFSETLSVHERTAAGLAKLEPAQREALDALIEKELTLARDGNVRGFAGSFSRRRSEEEKAQAGLGLLTPVEVALLDAHVAQRMARPSFSAVPVRTRREGGAESVSSRPEVHGSVTLFYGTGGGGSYRGGAMTMTMDDPARNLSISVTYSTVHGKGSTGRYVTRRAHPDER